MGTLAKTQPRHTDRALGAADALSRAAEMLRQGELRKSEALSRDVVERQPDNAHARYLRGLALRAMKDLAGARTCLEAAIAKGFTDAVAYLEHARTLVLLGERGAAEAQYRKVRQQAAEKIEEIRDTTVGDMVDGALDVVRKHPGPSLLVAAALGFLFDRWLRK
jgi:tetratricopeptide (TPR) repeat protein